MANGRPKPAIPEWQRTAQSKPAPTEDPVYSQPEESQGQQETESKSELKEVAVAPVPTEEDVEGEENTGKASDNTSDDVQSTAAEQIKPGSSFGINDFETFRRHVRQQTSKPATTRPSSTQQQRPAAPPIITYPEFLVEAHKPPPLITPGRVLNFTYGAGAVAALLYGASKWILNPMQDSLSEARHVFFSHSQSKVDELNERLAQIVTKVPDTKQDGMSEVDVDDADSETSDPTELYHRDMGTQTSPPPTRRSSLPGGATQEKRDPVTYQAGALDIMKSHLEELATGSEKTAEAYKDRQETMNKLRHYLDGLTYGGASYAWQLNDDAMASKNGSDGKNDEIEHFKKEIRSVKGLLLSAKRFPAASRPIAGAA